MTEMSPIRDRVAWESAERFRAGMRRLASGVAVITAGTSVAPAGLVVTAVCSVSIDPPTLLVSVNHAASAYEAIAGGGRFVVNVLGDAHRDVMETFTDPARRRERFASPQWTLPMDGPPVLEGALARFDCRVVEQFRYHTHTLFLGRPTVALTVAGEPIIHFDRRFFGLA